MVAAPEGTTTVWWSKTTSLLPEFTVSSDGNGDDIFELVEAEAIFARRPVGCRIRTAERSQDASEAFFGGR